MGPAPSPWAAPVTSTVGPVMSDASSPNYWQPGAQLAVEIPRQMQQQLGIQGGRVPGEGGGGGSPGTAYVTPNGQILTAPAGYHGVAAQNGKGLAIKA